MKDYAGRLNEISPPMQELVRNGMALSGTAYYAALDIIIRLRETLHDLFTRFDLILTPSIAAVSWPAAEPFPPIIDGQSVGPRGHAVFTAFANMGGCSAISVPCAPSQTGLPIGFQLVGDIGQDETLLAVAASYEGWLMAQNRRPPAFAKACLIG
jgi:aspartyl-tRNA(Asn)/glutamyl-tRNA(Gln) amidotransferase subunit A